VANEREVFLANLTLIEQVIHCVARRQYLRAEDAEEFASLAKLKIISDDYAVLRKFREHSSLGTYLTVVIYRHCQDYRNHLWGRWRPSVRARQLGPLAVELERLLVRDGQSLDEACEILRRHHDVSASRRELADLAAQLPARTTRRMETEEPIHALAAADPTPEERLLTREREEVRRRLSAALAVAVADFPPEDRLLVKLRVEQGKQVVEIARALRLEPKSLYRRLEGILDTLRDRLETQGFHVADMKEALSGTEGTPP
jgi:RNA polymerase sigma factor for flagellar operon FliA